MTSWVQFSGEVMERFEGLGYRFTHAWCGDYNVWHESMPRVIIFRMCMEDKQRGVAWFVEQILEAHKSALKYYEKQQKKAACYLYCGGY